MILIYKPKFLLVQGVLETRSWGNEISWAIMQDDKIACASEAVGTYGSHNMFAFECKLCTNTKYKIHCKDSFGDGWHGGFLTVNGYTYCDGFCTHTCSGDGLYAPEGAPQTYGGTLRIEPANSDGVTFSTSDG